MCGTKSVTKVRVEPVSCAVDNISFNLTYTLIRLDGSNGETDFKIEIVKESQDSAITTIEKASTLPLRKSLESISHFMDLIIKNTVTPISLSYITDDYFE